MTKPEIWHTVTTATRALQQLLVDWSYFPRRCPQLTTATQAQLGELIAGLEPPLAAARS
jgi:hypothetical protein